MPPPPSPLTQHVEFSVFTSDYTTTISDAMANNHAPPRNFEEEYRASNWWFGRYRTEGYSNHGNSTLGQYRAQWLALPFPKARKNPVRPARDNAWQEALQVLYRRPFRRPIDGTPRYSDGRKIINIRARVRRTRNWFQSMGPFTYQRTLGYGGLGLALHFKWADPMHPNPDIDLVLKIGLHEYMSEDIRLERRMMRVPRTNPICLTKS